MKLNSRDLAYIAGIVDGEGCISLNLCHIYHGKRIKEGTRITIALSVYNTYFPLLKYLKAAFGGTLYNAENPKGFSSKKALYQWRVAEQRACEILKLLLPHLKVKKKQAILALRLAARKRRNKGRRLTAFEIKTRLKIVSDCHKLNQKGGLPLRTS